MKHFLLVLVTLLGSNMIIAQKTDTITDPEVIKSIVKESGVTNRNKIIKQVRDEACNCIEKISLTGKSAAQLAKEVSVCIESQVNSYEMLVQMAESLENPGKNATITVTSPGSEQYKKYYYKLETALADSCSAMRQVVSNSNEESENSSSKDPKAVKYYEEGVDYMKQQEYKKAVSNFKKAVEADSMFSFAWDNLGVCNRKLGNLDDALHAYRQSLKINPYGKLPLQNIPIVYMYKKEYDKAIQEYQHLANVYPDDPETFYGIGNILVTYKEEYEEGLRNMCKAYNMYIQLKSPYRVDAEKQINFIYAKLKEAGKEKLFFEILKENGISPE